MKVLITGITGMVGSHLAEFLLAHRPDDEIHGLVRWRSPLENIQRILPRITLHQGDLRDLNSLVTLLNRIKPGRIHHLAAQSYVDMSFVAPADTLNANIIGTVNLLDAIRIADIRPRVHICSSSEVYGQVLPSEVPIKETTPLRPASPYAVSKVGEDLLAYQYGLSYKLDLIRTRMFTHTGPRRGDVFAESSFAKQIAEIEAGKSNGPVRVGNLDSVRTISDVRDAVQAYDLLLDKCPPGEVYNIGGHETMTVGEVLEILKSFATVPITHVIDPSRLRPSDVTLQVPDTTKFRIISGWEAKIPARQTLRDLLDYHRERIRAERT
jgi:GDP-mannose 4,6-dehydratase